MRPECRLGHRALRDGHRRPLDGRRNRHRLRDHLGLRDHRDGRRNRRHLRRHRGDRERHREPDAHRGDPPLPDRASCPGSDEERLDGDRRHLREPDGHPAGAASPGLARRGCCPDEQQAGRHVLRGAPELRGLRAARGLRGHLGASPGSARKGCCRDAGRRGGGPGDRPPLHLHVPQAPLGPGPRGRQHPDERAPLARPSWLRREPERKVPQGT